MTPLKIQVEIRYKQILDFHERYRRIIAPQLKVAAYAINNAGTFDESVMLQYQSEGYAIDVRGDRLVFFSDSKQDNLFTPNGQLFHYLKIFESLTQLETFVGITTVIFATINLFESKKSQEDVLTEFKQKNIKTSIPDSEFTLKDIGVQLIFRDSDNNLRVDYGPFIAETDITTHGLHSLNTKELDLLKEKNGILSQSILAEKSSEASIDIFKRMDKKVNQFLKQLEEKVWQ